MDSLFTVQYFACDIQAAIAIILSGICHILIFIFYYKLIDLEY